MSLSEVQQLYSLLVEIDAVLKGVTVKTAQVEQKLPITREALTVFRELERLALRYLVLAKRMNLPEEWDKAVTAISELIVTIRMLQMSVNMMMSSNPITVMIGIAGMFGSALSMTSGSFMEGY